MSFFRLTVVHFIPRGLIHAKGKVVPPGSLPPPTPPFTASAFRYPPSSPGKALPFHGALLVFTRKNVLRLEAQPTRATSSPSSTYCPTSTAAPNPIKIQEPQTHLPPVGLTSSPVLRLPRSRSTTTWGSTGTSRHPLCLGPCPRPAPRSPRLLGLPIPRLPPAARLQPHRAPLLRPT